MCASYFAVPLDDSQVYHDNVYGIHQGFLHHAGCYGGELDTYGVGFAHLCLWPCNHQKFTVCYLSRRAIYHAELGENGDS